MSVEGEKKFRGRHIANPDVRFFGEIRHTCKHRVARDIKRRIYFRRTELVRNLLKSLRNNIRLPQIIRSCASIELEQLGGSRVKVSNRCAITGRSKSVSRMFRLSRLSFRRMAVSGLLSGVSKSSW